MPSRQNSWLYFNPGLVSHLQGQRWLWGQSLWPPPGDIRLKVAHWPRSGGGTEQELVQRLSCPSLLLCTWPGLEVIRSQGSSLPAHSCQTPSSGTGTWRPDTTLLIHVAAGAPTWGVGEAWGWLWADGTLIQAPDLILLGKALASNMLVYRQTFLLRLFAGLDPTLENETLVSMEMTMAPCLPLLPTKVLLLS